jgi:DNA-binding NarL/FixJ family response regulator
VGAASMTTTQRRILVVDDEADARELLVAGLRRQGFSADGACDGLDALAMLVSGYDVVVTDLLMPRCDGLSLLNELRTKHPGIRRIVITSFGDKSRVLAALNAGADYLLEKPFGVQQLTEVINRLTASGPDERTLDQWFTRRLSSLGLTPREHVLVALTMKGMSNKEIAGQLQLGEQTVKNALFTLYQKLGIASRGELFHLVFPI